MKFEQIFEHLSKGKEVAIPGRKWLVLKYVAQHDIETFNTENLLVQCKPGVCSIHHQSVGLPILTESEIRSEDWIII